MTPATTSAPRATQVAEPGRGEPASFPPRALRAPAQRARSWRCQPPAHTPLRAGAILAALARPRSAAHADVIALLRTRHGVDDVSLWDSGTTALRSAIDRALAGTGRRVVALPAFACYDVAAAAVAAGARIALYDIEPATLLPDADSLARTLEAGPAAVVAAPLFGISPDWRRLGDAVRAAGALLIEDAAQAFSGSWQDRWLGGFGDLSVLSFGRGKGWSGAGGGALLAPSATRDLAEPAALSRSADARRLLVALAQSLFARPGLYALPAALPFLHLGETLYHEPGEPRGMGAGGAGLLLELAEAADAEALCRIEAARRYRTRLSSSASIRILSGARPGYLRYPVRLSGPASARAASQAGRSLGIAPVYPGTLARLPELGGRLVDPSVSLEGAETLVRELFTLPTHSLVTAAERDRIVELVSD